MAFVLWASERIRTRHPGGALKWNFLLAPLGLQRNAIDRELLVECGLARWKRRVGTTTGGTHQFLYSLMAEGGMPDALLAEIGHHCAVFLAILHEVEKVGALGAEFAFQIAKRRTYALPQVFQSDDSARLFADLAIALAKLRARIPDHIPMQTAERYLNGTVPDWRLRLPLRLSEAALANLIRPALRAERQTGSDGRMIVHRRLMRAADGAGRIGIVVFEASGFLPAALLPATIDRTLRLRLLPLGTALPAGLACLAVPDGDGWRLSRPGACDVLKVPLPPDVAVTMSVHADGRHLCDVVLDPGLPAPAEAVSLWRPEEQDGSVLAPLASGRTRAPQLWLLAPAGAAVGTGQGLTLLAAEPGPVAGSTLHAVSGTGTAIVGEHRIAVQTGAASEDEPARLVATGPEPAGWRATGPIPVMLGEPCYWGGQRQSFLRIAVRERPLPGVLGGRVAEWHRKNGEILARTRLAVLPADFRARLRETGPGRLTFEGKGLAPEWCLSLSAAGGPSPCLTHAAPDGTAIADLAVDGAAPAKVALHLFDPVSGEQLDLEAFWPARHGMFVDPDGHRLQKRDTPVALGSLGGWRGQLPPSGGKLEFRLPYSGASVAMQADGDIRLAAYEPLLRALLAMTGPDERITVSISTDAVGGRVQVGRYDRAAPGIDGPVLPLSGRWDLKAVRLDGPPATMANAFDGPVDLSQWPGEEGLWFVQGRSAEHGIMRPVTWTRSARPASTRDQRISDYAILFRQLLDAADKEGLLMIWSRIEAVMAAGDAGGLDQVQALGDVPAALVAMLMLVEDPALPAALALDQIAPAWLALVRIDDWTAGLRAAMTGRTRSLMAVFPEETATGILEAALQRRAGLLKAARPELAGHLASAFLACGLRPLAGEGGRLVPLIADWRWRDFRAAASKAVAGSGSDPLPDGVSGIAAQHLHLQGQPFDPVWMPVIEAPLVAAEIATGRRLPPGAADRLRLLSLRLALPGWFDTALPIAIRLAGRFPACV